MMGSRSSKNLFFQNVLVQTVFILVTLYYTCTFKLLIPTSQILYTVSPSLQPKVSSSQEIMPIGDLSCWQTKNF